MSAILLDLDGTLVDPAKGIFACIRYALARCGVDEPDERDLRGPSPSLLVRLFVMMILQAFEQGD